MVNCKRYRCRLEDRACTAAARMAGTCIDWLLEGLPSIAIPEEYLCRLRTCGDCRHAGLDMDLVARAREVLRREFDDAVKALELDWTRNPDGYGLNWPRMLARNKENKRKRREKERERERERGKTHEINAK